MKVYKTAQGDTYDQIALKVYGSCLATRDMMAENGARDPRFLLVWRFDAAVPVRVPELTPDTSTVQQMPAWRRPEND